MPTRRSILESCVALLLATAPATARRSVADEPPAEPFSVNPRQIARQVETNSKAVFGRIDHDALEQYRQSLDDVVVDSRRATALNETVGEVLNLDRRRSGVRALGGAVPSITDVSTPRVDIERDGATTHGVIGYDTTPEGATSPPTAVERTLTVLDSADSVVASVPESDTAEAVALGVTLDDSVPHVRGAVVGATGNSERAVSRLLGRHGLSPDEFARLESCHKGNVTTVTATREPGRRAQAIGLILATLLFALIGTYVLGVGESEATTGIPNVEFSFEYERYAEGWKSTITHAGGDSIDGSLVVRWEDGDRSFEATWTANGGTIEAGDTYVQYGLGSGVTLRVVWERGEAAATIGSSTTPRD